MPLRARFSDENLEEAQVKVIRELGAALLAAKDGQIARMIKIAELEEIAYESQIN